MVKVGQTVEVWEDPITKTTLEGRGRLTRWNTKEVVDGLRHGDVEMEDGEIVSRWIAV